MPRMVIVVAAAGLLGAAAPSPAAAARYCHGMPVGDYGDVYWVKGTGCKGGRRVGRRWTHRRALPGAWTCSGARRNTGERRIVFRCTAPGGRRLKVYDAEFAD